ncbi:CocE/NonD family hydrolase C-terminal non-catalytic domain-containing protein [Fodinicola feengrottensis]|uniref:CocE/NonD family hydrolase C-terminal non-catalytic domain-containing protein n=1 Tax=Fodinicola feengrottensis TaxID=435914 RepID=UPI0024414558|nr:CocE/NonD family hydrolase C-terminal non-catalytic domain-containing protein [Fodinicola feengrottensis]
MTASPTTPVFFLQQQRRPEPADRPDRDHRARRGQLSGIFGSGAPERLTLSGRPQNIAAPPNGNPAAISSLPGLGSAGALASRALGAGGDLPGQVAFFSTPVLAQAVSLTGSAQLQLKVAAPSGSAVLFVRLEDLSTSGRPSLPQGLVAPVRLTGLAATLDQAKPVTITLPALAYRFQAGHQIRVAVSTTDQAYAMPVQPASYQIGSALAPGS